MKHPIVISSVGKISRSKYIVEIGTIEHIYDISGNIVETIIRKMKI